MSNQGSRQKLSSVEVSALASKFSRLLYKGEQGSDVSLEDMARLSPLGHGPGTPKFFSVEQAVQIVAIACEAPKQSQHPVSHWTPTELAAEAKKRGIVELNLNIFATGLSL